MMKFYDFSHNTAYMHGLPEIEEIVHGLVDAGSCPSCGICRRFPKGDLQVRLENRQARFWPDVIACGDYPCLVVSENFVNSAQGCGIRLVLGGKVEFDEANVSNLSIDDALQYFWIDGMMHFAAKMDFIASGYVDVHFCEECGNRSDNISLTYDKRHADPPPPTVFEYDSKSGLDLFTTDLAPTAFFCTDRMLECARRNKLTNIAFCPVEQGVFGEPLKY